MTTSPGLDPALAVRTPLRLLPDPRRVITKLFIPGEERPEHDSRSAVVIRRVLAMDEQTVTETLLRTTRLFAGRHPRLAETFAEHFDIVSHRLDKRLDVSAQRRQLIGAYFTHEYAVEAAALCNPSMVAHPDQSGLADGELRFVLSVRGIGEGHLSSIGFRTGVIGADGQPRIDPPRRFLTVGRSRPPAYERALFDGKLLDFGHDDEIRVVLRRRLPERFTTAELDDVLDELHPRLVSRPSAYRTIEQIRWIAANNYVTEFPDDRSLSERVLWPTGPAECQGMEDARFTRFVHDDGTAAYYATYTAFDGDEVTPQLLHTKDFRTFNVSQMTGTAARNKGMALFPRRVGGRFVALSRGDAESTSIVTSQNIQTWQDPHTLQAPARDWELVQVGNCGSPIETEHGWLVLTHGVGPMRVYSIGAMLLDLDNPERVLAALPEPLLSADATERDGYVPNVVYSCGGLLHRDTVVIPYGASDATIAVATVALPELLDRMRRA
ncbi:glycoside hydrolase family 130 protein [Kutzneria sp. 744]|uniref:glycoside hydrolase family 130 protein n=1 Tax=Kutzneria sp. (strain 744) TaxID=345341 RepID=UPI0003EECCF0|nr:glycoside hydrolase family 130 protein [Kutzneria sp. 744]EWM12127.1 glycosidase [Kutzneria sp. 744]